MGEGGLLGGGIRVICGDSAVLLQVINEGWRFVALDDAEKSSAPEELRIRGYKLVKDAERILDFAVAGDYIVDEACDCD